MLARAKGALSYRQFALVIVLFGLGLGLRILNLPAVSGDMKWFLLPWYNFLRDSGAQGLGQSFSNYTPPYLYLLWLATLSYRFIPPVVAIKLISIAADGANAALIYALVRLQDEAGARASVASAVFWVLPTVWINSSLWGQADGIYTALLLSCLYFLLTDRPFWGVAAFAAAFTFKAQAFFLFPLLLILWLKGRLPWNHFLLIPLVYALLCLPAVLLGYPWRSVLTIYLTQANTYHSLSKNAPNLYVFMNAFPYGPGVALAFLITALAVGAWVWYNVRARSPLSLSALVWMSLISSALVPFFLPKMQDRYFYPSDVLSLLAAFYVPGLWFAPVLYQVISLLAYSVSLLQLAPLLLQVAAILNLFTISTLIWKQSRSRMPVAAPSVADRPIK